MDEDSPILLVEDLKTHFSVKKGFLQRDQGRVRAVDGVSFELRRGEIMGIVGESGSGKSTVARTIMGLEKPTDGQIKFDGSQLQEMDAFEKKAFRRRVQMVFQDTDSSFDPRMTVGDAIREPMIAHGLTDSSLLSERTSILLEAVGLSEEFNDQYPHQLSGGEKQRAALARALSLGPDVLVLDEPVSALDVSVQAQIIRLIKRLQQEFGLSIVLITHDMTVIKELCSRVGVMYLGEIVELAPTGELFRDPSHPYTAGLIEAIPIPDPTQQGPQMDLQGSIPDPIDPPPGCRFHTRCPKIIQPPNIDMDQEVYRSIYDLRIDLRDGTLSLDSVIDREEETSARVQADLDGLPAGSNRESAADVIRSEYGIPDELSKTEAEKVLSTALDRVLAEDIDRAQTILEDHFGSICEGESPGQIGKSDGHVACHLYGDAETPVSPTSVLKTEQEPISNKFSGQIDVHNEEPNDTQSSK